MQLSEQLLAIVLVLGSLIGALWILKNKGVVRNKIRWTKRSGNPQLEVIDRLPLGPQHSVQLIRVGDRTVLIGVAPGSCTLLETQCGDPAFASRPR